MVVVLVPWQAKEAMYFSVATSTLLSEIVLQIVSSYYMGYAVNYARVQKFFSLGRVDPTPHGNDALLMYAGALLWLIVIFFALIACASAILDLDKRISSLGATLGARIAKWVIKQCTARLAEINKRKARLVTLDGRNLPGGDNSIVDDFASLETPLRRCAEIWDRLRIYITDDAREYESTENKYRSEQKKVERARQKGHSEVIPPILVSRFLICQETWVNTPSRMRSEAEESCNQAKSSQSESQTIVSNLRITLLDIENNIQRLQRDVRIARAIIDTLAIGTARRLAEEARYAALLRDLEKERDVHQKTSNLLLERSYFLSTWLYCGLQSQNAMNRWTKLADARRQEQEMDPLVRRLRNFAITTVVGMFGCWIAQWVWWIGYIRRMGDSYCPPNLTEMGVIWTVFSAFGALFGGSF